jgi:hypothetical protein
MGNSGDGWVVMATQHEGTSYPWTVPGGGRGERKSNTEGEYDQSTVHACMEMSQ